MLIPLLVLLTAIISSGISIASFKRRCREAAETYDPVRTRAPRGLTSHSGCATLPGR